MIRLASAARWHADEALRLLRSKQAKKARKEDHRARVLRTVIQIRKEIKQGNV